MALPTQANITTMDYPSGGLPFVNSAAKSGIDPTTMDYPSRGLPLVIAAYSASGGGGGTAQAAAAVFQGAMF